MNRRPSQEPSELKIIFTNKTSPLDDEVILRIESDMTQTKKKIANIESNVRSSFDVIRLAREQCEHMIAANKIANGAERILEMSEKLEELEILGDQATAKLEEIRIQFPKTHATVCEKLNIQEESIKDNEKEL